MTKTMCKHAKDLPESMDKIIEIICNATYVCRKCARVANSDKKLCKPYHIT